MIVKLLNRMKIILWLFKLMSKYVTLVKKKMTTLVKQDLFCMLTILKIPSNNSSNKTV